MTPKQSKQSENAEIVALNAEDLDAEKLEDQDLEDVSGGYCTVAQCTYDLLAENPDG